jgi:hypothetical protein
MRLRIALWLMLGVSLLAAGAHAQSTPPGEPIPPLPDRNPMRPAAQAEPAPPKPLLPGEQPTVPWTEAEIDAGKEKCKEMLAGIPIDYEQLAPIKEGICGAPAPILLKSIGNDPKVAIDPPATVSCPLAKELGAWLKDSVQPEAKALLGSQVTKLHNATSYSCRNRYGAANTRLSEHALANALDVSEFVFASGARVTVLDAWPKLIVAAAPESSLSPVPSGPTANTGSESAAKPAAPKTGDTAPAKSAGGIAAKHKDSIAAKPDPATAKPGGIMAAKAAEPATPSTSPPVAPPPVTDPKSLFVEHVHDAACNDFGTVLGPEANEAHKSHFHLDMKLRRKGFCQ